MDGSPDPLVDGADVAADAAAVVDATPSLMWVLLTRIDGLALVVSVAGLLYLLVHAVVTMNKELGRVSKQLTTVQADMSEVHQQVSPRRDDAARQALERERQIQAEIDARVAERVAERITIAQQDFDRRMKEKDLELDRLLSVVEDAAASVGAAERVQRVLTATEAELTLVRQEAAQAVARAEAINQDLATAEEEAARLREHNVALEAQLDLTEHKLRQTSTVWDLLVEAEKNAAQRPLPPRPAAPAPRTTTPRSAAHSAAGLTPRFASTPAATGGGLVDVPAHDPTPRRPLTDMPQQGPLAAGGAAAALSKHLPSPDRASPTSYLRDRALAQRLSYSGAVAAPKVTTPAVPVSTPAMGGKDLMDDVDADAYLAHLEQQISMYQQSGM